MQKDLDEARDIIWKKDDELKLKENAIQSQSDELAKAYALIEKLQKTQKSNS